MLGADFSGCLTHPPAGSNSLSQCLLLRPLGPCAAKLACHVARPARGMAGLTGGIASPALARRRFVLGLVPIQGRFHCGPATRLAQRLAVTGEQITGVIVWLQGGPGKGRGPPRGPSSAEARLC